MTTEFEDLVDYDIPVESLTERLNWIRNYPDWTDGKLNVPYFPSVKETLVGPDGTYTVLWSKRSNVWIHEQVEVYRKILSDLSVAFEEGEKRRERIEVGKQEQKARLTRELKNQWNSRSWLYRRFNPEPTYDDVYGYYYSVSNAWSTYNPVDNYLNELAILKSRVGITTPQDSPLASCCPARIPGPSRPLSDPTRY